MATTFTPERSVDLIATGLDNKPALRAYERCGFQRHHFIMEWHRLLR